MVRFRRREVLWCAAIGCGVFFAVEIFNTFDSIVKAIDLLQTVRSEAANAGLPLGPFVWRGAKYIIFYAVGGALTGVILCVLAYLLARPATASTAGEDNEEADRAIPLSQPELRRRFWRIFAGLFLALLVYVHLRMMTLHPALFENSYRWAWFAGSATWELIVRTVGRIAPLLLALVLLRKYQNGMAISLRRAPRILWVGLGVLFVVGIGVWGSKQLFTKSATNTGPNVILIALDSLRPDHLSWKGLRQPYRRPTTPNIDRFLDDAVWFDQAFVPLARTYPSWLSILTGCWPPTNGVRFDLPPHNGMLPGVPTFAQALQKAGYRTAFFLDNTSFAWMEKGVGFDEVVQPPNNAVDFYISSVQPPSILYYYFLNNTFGYLYEPGLRINAAYRSTYRPKYMNREIARFLERMRYETKFFQAIHLCSIHVPFCVSYPYSTYFAPSFGPVLNRFGYQPLLEQILMKKKSKGQFSEEETAWVFTQEMNLYDALARSSDDNFGAAIEAIRKAGLYDNSYIIFMADHGENLPEPGLRYRYGSSTHGFFLWGDTDTRIPLAIKFPRQQYAGRRAERLARSIDLAPTLLESLALPPLDRAEGVSRLRDIAGQPDDRERWLYGETGLSSQKFFAKGHLDYEFSTYPEAHEVDSRTLQIYKKQRYMPNMIAVKDRMIRTERWKLISYPMVGEEGLSYKTELFDVIADPTSCNDISTSHPEIVSDLRARLRPFIERDTKELGTGPLRPTGERGGWLKEQF